MSETEAMKHLGNVLMLLAELHPDDRCKALDNAMAFYNEHNPTWRVEPDNRYVTWLVRNRRADRLPTASSSAG